MNDQEDIPPMKPVRADDAIPERPWQSPKRVFISLGGYILALGAAFVVLHWSPVPLGVVLTLGGVVLVALVASDIVRWRRRRRL